MATKTLTLPNLEQGTTYEFCVIAKGNGNTYDDSDASSSVQWTTLTKLATPVVTIDKTTSTFTASWSKNANAASYVLEYKPSTASNWTTANVPQPSSGSSVSKQITGLTSGATYIVRVMAKGSGNYVDSDYSTEASVIISTQLDSPSPTVTADTSTIYITWPKIANAVSYKVGYKKSNGSSFTYETVTATSAATQNWSKSGFTSGDTYLTSVQAIGDGDNYTNSPNPNTIGVTIKTKLTAPTGLAVSTRTTNSLTLTWTAVTNASSYTVYYKKGTGSYQSSNAASNSFPLNSLSQGDTYTFYVIANGTGNYVDSGASTTVTGKTKIQLDTPTGLAASNVLSTSATIDWNTVTNATSYKLTISDANGPITGYNNTSVLPANKPVSLTGLTQTREYTVNVIATSSSDDYVDSTAATLVFTTDTKLGTPTAPVITEKSISSLTVTWGAVSQADSYTLEHSPASEDNWTPISVSASATPPRTKEVTGLSQGTSYKFRVRAITTNDAYESGDYSDITTGTTLIKLPAPDGLAVTGITINSSTLVWNKNNNAASYVVKWKKTTDTRWNEEPVAND